MASILRDREAVSQAAGSSTSIAEALGKLGLKAAGGNYRAFNQACERYGLVPPGRKRQPPAPAAISGPPAEIPPEPAPEPAPAMAGHPHRYWLIRTAVLTAAGAAAGTLLVLAVRYGGALQIGEAVTACLLVLAAVAV